MSNQAAAALAVETSSTNPQTGLSNAYREQMADHLSDLLAANYRLMIKNHVYHWNVVGPVFVSFHELTEKHYTALFKAADELAERIRALGHLAPVNAGKLTLFSNDEPLVTHATTAEMLRDLIESHEETVRSMRKMAETAAEAGDLVTEDMLTGYLAFHEQAVWMLRAIATQ